MGRPRLELQQLLKTMGAQEVYFQPPNGTQMKYPAIVYEWDDEEVSYADNLRHLATKRYSITVIDRDPDSEIPDRIKELQYCSFNRAFAANDLNHYVFNLFF